jgi:hypothetical protein
MKRLSPKRRKTAQDSSDVPPLPSRTYGFIRGRELEGTYPGPPERGIWLITAQRIGKGWGHLPEAAWPYEPQLWPPVEPPGVDELANENRTTSYTRCRTVEDCRFVLSNGGGVLAAFQIDASWLDSDGDIKDPRNYTPETTHSLLLFECNDATETFQFVNSWGPTWGNEGFGNLPYRYWSDRLLEAWIPDNRGVAHVPTHHRSGDVVIARGAADWWGRQIHLFEIENLDVQEMVAWAIMIQTPSGLELEEFFVRPAFREAGRGRVLAETINGLRAQLQLPLKAWISHADWPASPAQEVVLKQLGLRSTFSAERWAAASAVEVSKDQSAT